MTPAEVPGVLSLLAKQARSKSDLGMDLFDIAKDMRAAKRDDLALSAIELAYEFHPFVRWGNGMLCEVPAFALALVADQGTRLDAKRAKNIVDRARAVADLDPATRLGIAYVHLARANPAAATAEVSKLLAQAPLFVLRLELDPKLAEVRKTPAYAAAAKRAKAALPPDPEGVLPILFGLPAPVAVFMPGASAREAPTDTVPILADLYGRAVPAAFATWTQVLDRFCLGYGEIYDWHAWNPQASYRVWKPPYVTARGNAFAKLFANGGLAEPSWADRAKTSTLHLVLAGAIVIGRTNFDNHEFGLHLDPAGRHDEVLIVERGELAVVAADFVSFVSYQARAEERGKQAKKVKLPPRLATRVRFGPKLHRGIYAVHGEGSYTHRSNALAYVKRATWVADLLNGIPKLAAIVAEHAKNAEHGKALVAIWNERQLVDSVPEGLYWLWHLYFTGEDAILAAFLPRAAKSKARYVRDAAALVASALKKPTKLGKIELQKARKAFLAKLGEPHRALESPT